ncbi:MAG: acetyl-CoA carboxylase biotin carboxyl carrier protein [Verrucomicrobia bacterium]|nr:acetyl-CoA carboxylase biotin carboxyl carrier protein [Verrucomicrobiota bacterium]
MDFEDIKSIVELMNKNSISEFEMEKEDFKIKLRRGAEGYTATTSEGGPYLLTPPPQPQPQQAVAAPPATENPAPQTDNHSVIASPMIGTFYTAPAPDAATYVEVGTEVDPETVVCIIEAMKVMNEIKAETKGVISEIVAPNAKPVEFGQPLFKVRPL